MAGFQPATPLSIVATEYAPSATDSATLVSELIPNAIDWFALALACEPIATASSPPV